MREVHALIRSTSTYKPLDIALLNNILSGSMFSRRIVYREKLDSTNRYARALCEQGAPEGTVVVAEYQSAGRGRKSRKWLAEPRSNLLFSIVLRPGNDPGLLFLLNCAASLAIVKVLFSELGLKAGIKWPNDIYVGSKKLAGLLGEFSMAEGELDYVVLGIGLNVYWSPRNIEEGQRGATCIQEETGQQICRTRLLGSILVCFEAKYRLLGSGQEHRILNPYKDNSIVLGREVEIIEDGETIRGIADDIAIDGSLTLISGDGLRKSVRWGDVSVRI